MKQTAVEWLYEQLWNTPQDKWECNAILQQAKAMEQEQITQSFIGGADFREINKHHNRSAATCAEQYYRTNFKAKIAW
jgi:hypothetical protein